MYNVAARPHQGYRCHPFVNVVLMFCNVYSMFKGADFIFLSAYLMFLVVVFMYYQGCFMFSFLNNSDFFQNMI